MGAVKWLAIPLLMAFSCYAQNPPPAEKPACNAENRGKIWPEKAARHSATAPIELCSMRFWRYRWQQLTVDISHLRAKPPQLKPPAPPNALKKTED
jgi:hypothetical protein